MKCRSITIWGLIGNDKVIHQPESFRYLITLPYADILIIPVIVYAIDIQTHARIIAKTYLAVTSDDKRFANFTTIPDTDIGAALRRIMSRYIKTDIGVIAGADFAILAENKTFDAVGKGSRVPHWCHYSCRCLPDTSRHMAF